MPWPGLGARLADEMKKGFLMVRGQAGYYAIVAALVVGVSAMAQSPPAPPSPDAAPGQYDPQLVKRPPAAQKPPSVITAEGRIHLDVRVVDAAGKPVRGLEPTEFKVLDDGQPRRILSFRSFDGESVKPDPPVQVILVVDTANLPFTQVAFVRTELEKFLRQNGGHLAQPVSIFQLSEAGLRVQPRPSVDGDAMVTVLNQIKGGLQTAYGTMGAEADLRHFQESVRQLTAIAENESTQPGRKLLIWVGPGWPILDRANFSFTDRDQQRYFDAIVELSTKIREARMVVYSVAPSSSATGAEMHTTLYQNFLKPVQSPHQADTGNLALKVLALQSGGRIFGPDNNLAGQIDACIAEADAFYTLSFNPPQATHPDEFHELKVQVDQPGVTLRTSSGYYDQP